MSHVVTSGKVQLARFGELFVFFLFITHMLCVLSQFSPVQLCNPMDRSLPGSSVRAMLQARRLWAAMPLSGQSSQPRD